MTKTCICGNTFDLPVVQHGKQKRYCSHRCRCRENMRKWIASGSPASVAYRKKCAVLQRARHAANPAKQKLYDAARYAADPVGQRARVRAYRSIPEKRALTNASSAAWRVANPEKQRAARLRWEATHPEEVASYVAGWRARKRGASGSHTAAEWRARCAFYENRCFYCGSSRRLSRDHDIPLSRGGTDDIMNIIPACRLCNSKKRTKTAAEYLAVMPTIRAA